MDFSFQLSVWLRKADSRDRWDKIAGEYVGLSFSLNQGPQSYWEHINGLISSSSYKYVLCSDGYGWIPKDIASRSLDLVIDLERLFGSSSWGVASNAGIIYPGLVPKIFVRGRYGLSQHRYKSPLIAAFLEGNLLFLNIGSLRKMAIQIPAAGYDVGHDVILSSECYRKGLICILDSRLFSVESRGEGFEGIDKLESCKPLRRYWRSTFPANPILRIEGSIPSDQAMQSGASLKTGKFATAACDYLSTVRRAVLTSTHVRRPLSLSIIVRTIWNRDFMLKRLLHSIEKALETQTNEFPVTYRVEVLVVSDQLPNPEYDPFEFLKTSYPTIHLRNLYFPASDEHYSRVHLLIKGLMASESDFFWLVDDDDIVCPDALTHIFSSIIDSKTLIIGDTEEFLERNEIVCYEKALLATALRKYKSEEYVLNISGLNHVPICGIIYPSCVKASLNDARMYGDYYEDYALSMIALCSKDINVFCLNSTICRISKRGPGHNTTSETNRDWWNFSITTFLTEIINNADCGPQIMYDLHRFHDKVPTWTEFLKKKYGRPLKKLKRFLTKKFVIFS